MPGEINGPVGQGDLVISRQGELLIALAMTSASFDGAQRNRVVGIEADTDAMQYIAQHVGYTGPSEALSPLVVVTRDSSDTRAVIGRWDDRLPAHRGQPNTGRFFPAGHLDRGANAGSINREGLVEIGRAIGAPALTEVSIASWAGTVRRAGDFAAGLLLGQRPLDLPPGPSAWNRIRRLATPESQALAAIQAVRGDATMPEPFVITYRSGQPELPGRS